MIQEHITKFRKEEQDHQKKIEGIRLELQQQVSQINSETKKHVGCL